MPPTLVDVQIPVISLSPRKRQQTQRRTYGDDPLPIKPSDVAPRKAHIISRVAEADNVSYTLLVGDVQIDDVGIDEVLDYVSPYDLEQFENRQFEEEREILRIAEFEAEAEEERRRQRRKQRAKTKRIVIYKTSEDQDSAEHSDMATGKHGRARPDYKHMFLPAPEKRRRRKRDPLTNELLPFSDDEGAVSRPESADQSAMKSASSKPVTPADTELSKRRRRKRDPVTGELLPLKSISQPQHDDQNKRPRRRRHPVTGELMPLGWRYDPEAEEGAPGNRLSITREHDAKRVKLTSEVSSDGQISSQTKPKSTEFPSISPNLSNSDIDMQVLESDEESGQEGTSSMSPVKPTPKTSIVSPTAQNRLYPPQMSSSPELVTLASFLKASAVRAGTESSDESSTPASHPMNKDQVKSPKTSIMKPMAAQPSANEDASAVDELDEGEWYIEDVLAHNLTASREQPEKMVMLYKVKWEGYDDPTWEPAESFPDESIIRNYHQRVGLGINKGKRAMDAAAIERPRPSGPTPSAVSNLKNPTETDKPRIKDDNTDDGDSEEEDGYEVESIRGHRMSDPRTHPGKPSTMLYHVKWVDYKDLTWEPRTSFTDQTVVDRYDKKVALK